MKKRLRPKLSYANVIATVAMFLALGGGAYAATALPSNSVGTPQLKKGAVTGAKVKSGSLLASNFKAGQLPAGPQGARGAQGPKGAQGAKGEQGKEGEKGKTGPEGSPWTAGGTLPPGASLKGAYALIATSAPNERVGASISFPIPLASAPTAHFIRDTEIPPPACPGTAAAPKAAPGNLCIYEAFSDNVELQNFEDPITTATGATVQPFGANVVAISVAAGDVNDTGSWAVTAP